MNSDTGDDNTQQNNYSLTLLNNTFYNVANGLCARQSAPEFAARSAPKRLLERRVDRDEQHLRRQLAVAAIRFNGQQYNTMAQYNVFFNNTINVDNEELTTFGFGGNTNPIIGDPKFRNAATGDFRLLLRLGRHRRRPERDRPHLPGQRARSRSRPRTSPAPAPEAPVHTAGRLGFEPSSSAASDRTTSSRCRAIR